MCGIWGIFNKRWVGFTQKEVELMKQMMVLTALRGDHSTGFFTVAAKKFKETPSVWKTLGDPYNFIFNSKERTPVVKQWLDNSCAVVGHGRAATVGSITMENAHPFQEGDITLVHNGNVTNLSKFKDQNTEVDSHVLTKAISEVGVVEALSQSFGAYAITFHDQETGKIYFARNDQRPLHCAMVDDTFIVMSEKEALEYLLLRNKKKGEVQYFKPEVVYSLDLEDLKLTEGTDLKAERAKKYQTVVHTPQNYGYNHNYPSGNAKPFNESNVVPRTTKKVLTFEVKSMAGFPKGRDYRYDCLGTDGESCYFLTSEKIPELVGRKGCGKITNFTVTDQQEHRYFIKYRQIMWEDKLIETITPEVKPTTGQKVDAEAGGPQLSNLFLLTRGRLIPKTTWVNLCEQSVCKSCTERLDPSRHAETFVDSRNRVLCPACVDFAVTEFPTKNLESITNS